MKGTSRFVIGCALLAALTVVAGAGAGGQSPPTGDARRLVGAWRLVSFETNDQEMRQFRGARPTGLIIYDATGHMSVQIMPDRARPRFTGPVSGAFTGPRPTAGEALEALSGYTAYFGTYTVDEKARSVTHQRVGNLNPGALGDFVRRYEFLGDGRLALVPLDRQEVRTSRLVWERITQ